MDVLTIVGQTNTAISEILLRLVLAVAFGMVIGIDRELRRRPAGLRTHMLIALTACVFTLITFELFYEMAESQSSANTDPIRIIEAVTAGVAFLAAGTIIQARGNVRGLTTGASMWLAGSIGLACGGGFYAVAMLALLIALPILVILGQVERWFESFNADGPGHDGRVDHDAASKAATPPA